MTKTEILTITGNDLHIQDVLEFEGPVRIDCNVIGNIRTKGLLIIGAGATVRGALIADELDVSGVVLGDVVAGRKLTLRNGSKLCGNLKVLKIEAEDGSVFNGRIRMPASEDPEQGASRLISRRTEPLFMAFLPKSWTKSA